MGGVPEILQSIASSLIGGYLVFHATVTNMTYLYRIKSHINIFGYKAHDNDEPHADEGGN